MVPLLHVIQQLLTVEVAKQLNDKDFVVVSCIPKSHINQPNNKLRAQQCQPMQEYYPKDQNMAVNSSPQHVIEMTQHIVASVGQLKRALKKKRTCRN